MMVKQTGLLNHLRKKLSTLALLLLLLCVAAPALVAHAQDQDERKKQVLILHSYHVGYKWTDDIERGIKDTLAVEQENIEIQTEYMDTKRISDEQYYEQLYTIYKHKFQGRRFDVIISSDNNAFNFLLQHRDELFPNTPVVFSGVNFFEDSMLAGHTLYTGVNEEVDLKATIDTALKLHPDTKQIVVVNDTTTTGQRIHERLTNVIPEYQDAIRFVLLEDVEMDEIRATVQNLPPDSLVLYTLFFRDKSGTFYEYDESISLVAEKSSVPVYGTWDFSLGHGIVGGMLTSGYFQGQASAEMALRIVRGENVSDIPVLRESPNRFMFDNEQLSRLDISASNLPAGSIIINRSTSFYSQYKGWIWRGGITITGLVSIIFALGAINVRRIRAEDALRESNRELQTIRDSLEQRVTERTAALEQRSVQLEAAVQVAREAAAIRDVNQLLNRTVHLISDRFGFYHAGIFLLDEAQAYAILRAASSEGGQRMLARRHQMRIGQEGIVGSVADTAQPRIALDVDKDVAWLVNPDLPLTRSEMALPLTVRGDVIGVLDVQSTEAEAFSEQDVATLQLLADQLALAIENARLLRERQDQLQEISTLVGQREKEGWKQVAAQRPGWGYVYDGVDVAPSDSAPTEETTPQLKVPLQVRDETIGHLDLVLADSAPTPEARRLVQAIADQASQALERARLYQDTQRRAEQEQLTAEITTRIRAETGVDAVLQRALEELSHVLGAERAVAHLSLTDNGRVED